MDKRITVIGGDKRFLYVKAFFLESGFEVSSFFPGEENSDRLSDTVILPVPVFRDGFLNAPFSEEKVSEKSLAGILKNESTVFGGMISDSFKKVCEEKGITLIDYYKDISLITENARLTGRAVPEVFRQENICVKGVKIFVLGFGRCGSAIAKELAEIGGNVTVVSSKKYADGFDLISFDELDNLKDAAVIVNTVPSPVLGEGELKKLKRNTVLTEIASYPFGIDFEAAARLHIRTIKAPSLPGRFFPKQAGEAIASTIFKEMNKCQK